MDIKRATLVMQDLYPDGGFTEEIISEFAEADKEGMEITELGYGSDMANKWNRFKAKQGVFVKDDRIQNEIVKAALKAKGNRFAEHFQLDTTSGQFKCNEDATIEDGCDTIKDLMDIAEGVQFTKDTVTWLIGNIGYELREKFGSKYDPAMIAKVSNYKEKTIRQYTNIYATYKGKHIPGVSYLKHQQLAYTKGLPPSQAILCLEASKEHELNDRDTTALGKHIAKKVEESEEEVLEITGVDIEIAKHRTTSQQKFSYFVIDSLGRGRVIKGHLEIKDKDGAMYVYQLEPSERTIKDLELE